MNSLYMIVTPYNPENNEGFGKRYLVKVPEHKWITPGDIVIAAKANGREGLFTAMTPEFASDDIIMPKWSTSAETIQTVVAILRREDLDVSDDAVMHDEPVIDG